MVSTMDERSERRGMNVSESMMDDVPSLMTMVSEWAEPTWRGFLIMGGVEYEDAVETKERRAESLARERPKDEGKVVG